MERRLVSRDLQHGSAFVTELTREPRRGRAALFAIGADHELGLDDLYAELRSRGYSTPGHIETFGGIGGTLQVYPFYVGLLVELGGGTFWSPRNAEGHLGVFLLELQSGWTLPRVGPLDVTPLVGIGGADVTLLARRRAGDPLPFRSLRASDFPGEVDVRKSMFLVDLGLMATAAIPLGEGHTRAGPGFGVQAGYLLSFAGGWHENKEEDAADVPGPDGGLRGTFVRLFAGASWDFATIRQDDRRVASCRGRNCSLECDSGYFDCDGEPRNGCETPAGTIDNCRGCGDICEFSHGHGVCTKVEAIHDHYRTCALASCSLGYANCNGDYDDGCETRIVSDPFDCGACGNACAPGERCDLGECVPAESRGK